MEKEKIESFVKSSKVEITFQINERFSVYPSLFFEYGELF